MFPKNKSRYWMFIHIQKHKEKDAILTDITYDHQFTSIWLMSYDLPSVIELYVVLELADTSGVKQTEDNFPTS